VAGNGLFDLDELTHALDVVRTAMPATPQYAWPLLSHRFGCEVWIKHENHTPTGAFKVRGGLVYLNELHGAGQLPAGLVTGARSWLPGSYNPTLRLY